MSDGGPVWWEDAVVYEVYPLPAHREILLASGPVTNDTLPPNTAAWPSS